MPPLTDEENKSFDKQKVCYIRKKRFSADDNNKKYHIKEIIVIILENIEELLMIFVI